MLLLLVVGARAQALPVTPANVGELSLLFTILSMVLGKACIASTSSIDQAISGLHYVWSQEPLREV